MADAARLATFMRAQFTATFGAQNDPANLSSYLDNAYGLRQQADELTDPDWETWLLEDTAGELAGYLQLVGMLRPRSSESELEIHRFYLDRRWHGLGVAQAMMAFALAQARRVGFQAVSLKVWGQNHRALAFYRKYGFTIVGTAAFLLGGDRQTDLVMRLGLR